MKREPTKFEKILSLYKKKYSMDLPSFITFVNEKLEASSFQIDLIKRKAQSFELDKKPFDHHALELALNITAAVQAYGNIDSLNEEQISTFQEVKIKITKSKPAQGLQDNSQSIPESLQEKKSPKSFPTPPKEAKSSISQIPKSESLELKLESKNEEKTERALTQDKKSIPPQNTNMMILHPIIKKVRILGYEKMGHDYINSVIKFKVVLGNNQVIFRRFSEFQKLMQYFSRKYEGFILPQLPAKEGIKRSFSYLIGIDEAFLNDRQLKLEDLLNNLAQSKHFAEDEVLKKFLTSDGYEVPTLEESTNTSYLKSIAQIALNAKEIKDYGLAYYNYLNEYKNKEIKTAVTQAYSKIQDTVKSYTAINEFRTTINENFQKRREIMLGAKLQFKTLPVTKLDVLLNSVALEIKNLNNQYRKYLDLKGQESWLTHLIQQKNGDSSTNMEIVQSKAATKARLESMEKNLVQAIEEFGEQKEALLGEMNALLMNWRMNVHP